MPIPPGLKVAGKLEPLEQPQSYRISVTGSGKQFVRTWRGAYSEVQALAKQLLAGGAQEIEYRQSQDSAVAEVSAAYGTTPIDEGGEQAVSTVDLDFIQTHTSIFDNPHFETIAPERIKILQALKEEARSGITESEFASRQVELGVSTNALELEALGLLLRDQDTYELELPVVVHTRTVSLLYQQRFALETTSRIFTTAQVEFATGSPILFEIPVVWEYIGEPAGYMRGWKKTTTLRIIANGNTQVQETYRYGIYSTAMYTRA